MTRYLAAALAAVLALPATAATLPDAIAKRGSIVAAVVPNYPPLEFKDPATGELAGFDIELGNALAAKLGTKMAWQETSFDQMLSSLATNRVDIVLSGMTDTVGRQSASTFVDYMKTGPQFFVRATRKGEFPSMESLCGKTVGASRRTNTPAEINAWSEQNCTRAGREAVRVVGTEGSADARTQLKQNRVDAAAQGSETLPYIMAQEPNAFAPVGATFKVGYNGIATRKDDKLLQDALSEALAQLIADGSYAALLKKYNMADQAVEKVTINAGE